MAQQGLSHRGLLADEALERVLPQRRHEADRLLLVVVRDIDDDLVEQTHHVTGRVVGDDLRRVHHPLQVADAAVVAVFSRLAALYSKFSLRSPKARAVLTSSISFGRSSRVR